MPENSLVDPYASPKTVHAKPYVARRMPSMVGEVLIFSLVSFFAAPAIWTIMWFFSIYLPTRDRDDHLAPTEWEKLDTLYGYLAWAFLISILVTPLVVAWRVSVYSRTISRAIGEIDDAMKKYL